MTTVILFLKSGSTITVVTENPVEMVKKYKNLGLDIVKWRFVA